MKLLECDHTRRVEDLGTLEKKDDVFGIVLDFLSGEGVEEALGGGEEERSRDVVGDVHAILREQAVDNDSVGGIPCVNKDGNENTTDNGNSQIEDKGHDRNEKHDEDVTALDLVVEVDHVTDALGEEGGDTIEQRSPLDEVEEADVEHDTSEGGKRDVLDGRRSSNDDDEEGDTRKEGGKTGDTIGLVGNHELSDHTSSSHATEDTGNDVADTLAQSNAGLDAVVTDAIIEDIGGQERFDEANAKDSGVPSESGHVDGRIGPDNLGEGGGNISIILNEGRLVTDLTNDGPLGNHTNDESGESAGNLLGGLGKEDTDEKTNKSLDDENDEGGRADPLGILVGEVSPGVTDLDEAAATLEVIIEGLIGPNLGITELLGGDEETHGIDETDHEGVGHEAHESTEAHEAEVKLEDTSEHDSVEDVVNTVLLNNLEKGKADEAGGAGNHPGRPPQTAVMTFMIQVAWRARMGLMPAMRAAEATSGI